MTIAEKLLRAKTDIDEVHEAGYGKGYADCSATVDAMIDGSITSISSEIVKTVEGYTFAAREKLISADFPNVKAVYPYAFLDCSSLSSVNLPNCNMLYEGCFDNCKSLESIDLNTQSIANYVFCGCTSLKSVTIRRATRCMAGSSIFMVTPIANGEGYIYVPASLVDSYKSATNWSEYADQIRAIQE